MMHSQPTRCFRLGTTLVVLAMAAACMGCAPTPVSADAPYAPSPDVELPAGYLVDADGEERLFQALNRERAAAGRAPLKREPALDVLARAKAADMAGNGYFDHISPVFGSVYDMLDGAGIAYKWAGENIARAGSADAAHKAFMESSDHRANILSAGYTWVGIGAVSSGNRVYVAQIFIGPR